MRLKDAIKNKNIPIDVLRMIDNLPSYGKEALDNSMNENSDFSKSSSIQNFFNNFSYDTFSKDSFYHYTTIDSLKKIINSKIWLIKQINFMNDPKEFKYTVELGIGYLEELGANIQEIEYFKNTFENSPFNDLYIWSFTKNGNSQTLFGNYSGNKNGVALKFNVNDIQKILAYRFSNGKEDLNHFSTGDAYVFPLRATYDKDAQREYLFPIMKEWLFARRCVDKDPVDMQQIILICMKSIKLFAMCFKNPLLRQEEEIRFIIANINTDKLMHPDLRINNVPFVKVNIDKDLIKGAILQTGNSIPVEEVENIFIKNGFNDVDVSCSELPY